MSKRILVIDDEESVQKSFVLALEEKDYQVDTVSSGEEGIEKVKENHYDLIYIDLQMPGLSGVETLKKLREIDSYVPAYLITAFHMEFLEPLSTVAKEGLGFEVLIKPIDLEQIALVTESVLKSPTVH